MLPWKSNCSDSHLNPQSFILKWHLIWPGANGANRQPSRLIVGVKFSDKIHKKLIEANRCWKDWLETTFFLDTSSSGSSSMSLNRESMPWFPVQAPYLKKLLLPGKCSTAIIWSNCEINLCWIIRRPSVAAVHMSTPKWKDLQLNHRKVLHNKPH